MKPSQRTLGPWVVSKQNKCLIFSNAAEAFVCNTICPEIPQQEAIDNAELIVKAVNRDHLFNQMIDRVLFLQEIVDSLRPPMDYDLVFIETMLLVSNCKAASDV